MPASKELIKVHCKSCDLLQSNHLLKSHDFKPSDILLYKIYVPDYVAITAELFKVLDSKEEDRAARFYKQKDQNRFIICRALLKFILAKHSQCEVSKITLAYHDNKKPYLPSHPALCFNVSHAEDYALIAIASCDIGVDIEYITKNDDLINTVTHIFSDPEIAFIQNAMDKHDAFYTLWTRKEAFVKALGKGIDDDISKIPSIDGFHSLDLAITNTGNTWQLEGFEIDEQYMGAVAYETQTAVSKNIMVRTLLPNNIKNLLELSL